MLNSKEDNTIPNRISKLMLWVLFVLFIISIGRTIAIIHSINQRIDDDANEAVKLEEKNEALKKQLEDVDTEFYLEKQIRDKLGYSKEGEVVLILPPDEVLLQLVPKSPEKEDVSIEPNWQKWAKLFGID
ncbi:MAG TPA: septum formation initiator family protein [Patescibacteria group bacterium]|nr:septum formation initiator family protein [Patescibacteria group bacterium]